MTIFGHEVGRVGASHRVRISGFPRPLDYKFQIQDLKNPISKHWFNRILLFLSIFFRFKSVYRSKTVLGTHVLRGRFFG